MPGADLKNKLDISGYLFEKNNFLSKELYLSRGEAYLSHSSLFKLWFYDYVFLGQIAALVS